MLISTDSKYLFQTDTHRIKVQNIKSGEIVYHLNYENKIIESICLNPLNKYQLLSFHSDGSVCLWDFEDGVLLKNYSIRLKLKKVITIQNKQSLFGLGVDLDSDIYSFYKLDFNAKNDDFKIKCLLENVDLNKEKLQIDLNYNAKFIAFVQSRRKVVVYNIKKQNFIKLQSKHELTCLAIHPNEDCIATGTVVGKIILWYGFLENNKPTKTILHWHALPVLSLCFTQEGSYLLSGGFECVLVKWMYKTGQKDFKPRLGSPIKEICCAKDNTIYAIDHADNSSHVIGTNFNILQTFSGFIAPSLANDKQNPFPTGLTYFSRLNCLVTNGKPGHLQFYVPIYEKLLFNLDIVDENYISPENLQRPKLHTEIEHISFNSDNSWLTTIERRDDSITTPEIRMKFWQFDQTNNKFSLNTIVRYPHSYEKLNQIKFKPKENVLITCGADACFKSWILTDNNLPINSNDKETKNWVYDTCNGYRNMIPKNIDYSLKDKNQVAISFNHIITLWNSENNMEFITDLIHCDPNDHINQILYSSNGTSSFLIAAHNNCVNLWNLNANFVCAWSKQLNVENISRHPSDNSIIFAFLNSKLSNNDSRVLEVATIKPDEEDLNDKFKIINKNVKLNINEDQKLNLVYLKKSEELRSIAKQDNKHSYLNNVDIFYCTNKMTLEKINFDDDSDNSSGTHLTATKIYKNLPENNLKLLLNQHKSQKFLDDQQKLTELLHMKSNLRKVDLTPAYLLPKVSSFCYDTLISMLEPTHKLSKSIDDVEMDIDEDKVKNNHQNSDESETDDKDDANNNKTLKKNKQKINGYYQVNGLNGHNGDDDDDDDESEFENKIDFNKNKISTIKVNNLNDHYANINETVLKRFNIEDFLIKFSK